MLVLVDTIQSAVMDAVRTFLYSLCTYIYGIIIFCYDLFERVSTAQILDNETVNTIISRVGLILGIFMLFRLTISFIQMLIDPDTISDKEKGAASMIKKSIIVIVLLGSISFIFKEAYHIQDIVMGNTGKYKTNLIASILVPGDYIASKEGFGGGLSYTLLTSFYRFSDNNYVSMLVRAISDGDDEILDNYLETDPTSYAKCLNYMSDAYSQDGESIFKKEVLNANTFYSGYNCLNTKITFRTDDGEEKIYLMEFNGLIALVVGLIMLWMLIVYCFSAGVRVVQLAFLQMIAPIPIMSYLSPKKDNMFTKWVKQCTTTYIDLFIRVAIINLVVYLSATIMKINGVTNTFKESTDYANQTPTMQTFLMVVIILALFGFAKKAPELLKELFPSSGAAGGDFGLSLKNRGQLGKLISGGAGAVAGAGVGLLGGTGIGGKAIGFLGGAFRGAAGGVKGKGDFSGIRKNIGDVSKKQAQVNKQRADWRAEGSTLSDRMDARARQALGLRSEYENLSITASAYDELNNELENTTSIKNQKARAEYMYNEYGGNSNQYKAELLKLNTMKAEHWNKNSQDKSTTLGASVARVERLTGKKYDGYRKDAYIDPATGKQVEDIRYNLDKNGNPVFNQQTGEYEIIHTDSTGAQTKGVTKDAPNYNMKTGAQVAKDDRTKVKVGLRNQKTSGKK